MLAEHTTMFSALRQLSPLALRRGDSFQGPRCLPRYRCRLNKSPLGDVPPFTLQLHTTAGRTQAHAREPQEEIARIERLPQEERAQLDEKARQGLTVVPGGTGGNSLEAQLNLAKGEKMAGCEISVQLVWSRRANREVLFVAVILQGIQRIESRTDDVLLKPYEGVCVCMQSKDHCLHFSFSLKGKLLEFQAVRVPLSVFLK
jgi:hypothetical protein